MTIAYEIIIFFLLIFAAGLFNAAEIAIASFGSSKIEDLKEIKDKRAPYFEAIQKNPEPFFGTVQITSTIFLVTAAMLAFDITAGSFLPFFYTMAISPYAAKISAYLVSIALVSFCSMSFGMLIPKAIGFRYAEPIGKRSVRFVLFLSRLLNPFIKIVTELSNLLLAPFNEKTNFSQSRLTEDEIRIIISEGVKSGALNKTEHEIIENVFEFNDLRANEVMVPRTEMNAVEMSENEKDLLQEIMTSGHSILPVYDENLDNISGVLHTKDIVKSVIEGGTLTIKNLLRPAYFVPETKLISEILKEMQNRGERLAIVTDEYGGTEGVITMEDILEEIVGEFSNTSQIVEYNRLPDGKYYVLGSMYIDDFNEVFNINLPLSDEYSTVAGFVSYRSGKILNIGEKLKFERLNFELIKKIRQKMVQFRIHSDDGEFNESVKT